MCELRDKDQWKLLIGVNDREVTRFLMKNASEESLTFDSTDEAMRKLISPEAMQSPICKPEASWKQIGGACTSAGIMAAFAPVLILCIYMENSLYHNIPNSEALMWGIMLTAAVFVIYCIITALTAEKNIKSPAHNPQGYSYQGQVLSSEDPHFKMHVRYYRLYRTCIMPDGITEEDIAAAEKERGFDTPEDIKYNY